MKTFYNKENIDLKNSKDRDRMYSRFDECQKEAFASIQNNVFTFIEACAGSGKTTVATAALLDMLANGDINNICYIRVADDRAQSIGFYPGTLEEKTSMYWQPFYDALETLGLQPDMITMMEQQEILKTSLDITLRGVNLQKCGIILDEVQNADIDTLRLVFTRCHDDVHLVALGDGRQKDQKRGMNDFLDYCNFLANSSMGNRCELKKNWRGRFSRLAEDYIFPGRTIKN